MPELVPNVNCSLTLDTAPAFFFPTAASRRVAPSLDLPPLCGGSRLAGRTTSSTWASTSSFSSCRGHRCGNAMDDSSPVAEHHTSSKITDSNVRPTHRTIAADRAFGYRRASRGCSLSGKPAEAGGARLRAA